MTRRDLIRWLRLLDANPKTAGMTIRQLQMLLHLNDPAFMSVGRRVKDIAQDMIWDKPVVTRAATNLADRGFTVRKPDPFDMRGCFILITPEGQLLADRLVARMNV